MRAWQLTPGFLVDRGPSRTAVVDSLSEELPDGPWRDLRDFVRLDAQGKVERDYAVGVWSIDEELSMTAFGVAGGEFRELTLRTFHGSPYRVSKEETVVLTGLREVAEDETLRFLAAALAEEQRRRDDFQREREARVAAIPGATTDPGFGPEYLRAQKLLRSRATAYGQERDRQLLETLGRFPGRSEALDLFVEGCRHAAFDPTVKASPRRPPARGAVDGPESLGRTLEELQRLLLADAEGQDHADAMQNASAFRRAADCIARARDLLAPPPAGR